MNTNTEDLTPTNAFAIHNNVHDVYIVAIDVEDLSLEKSEQIGFWLKANMKDQSVRSIVLVNGDYDTQMSIAIELSDYCDYKFIFELDPDSLDADTLADLHDAAKAHGYFYSCRVIISEDLSDNPERLQNICELLGDRLYQSKDHEIIYLLEYEDLNMSADEYIDKVHKEIVSIITEDAESLRRGTISFCFGPSYNLCDDDIMYSVMDRIGNISGSPEWLHRSINICHGELPMLYGEENPFDKTILRIDNLGEIYQIVLDQDGVLLGNISQETDFYSGKIAPYLSIISTETHDDILKLVKQRKMDEVWCTPITHVLNQIGEYSNAIGTNVGNILSGTTEHLEPDLGNPKFRESGDILSQLEVILIATKIMALNPGIANGSEE